MSDSSQTELSASVYADAGSLWQTLGTHLSLVYLRAPDYFDHAFYLGKPSGNTYFPGLKGWVRTSR